MSKIVVVDYGMGNVRSVAQALQHVAPGAQVLISSDADELLSSDRIVLPGQGAMPDCMRSLTESGLKSALLACAANKPLLGVCVGEQMLLDWSAEGETDCLGLIGGKVVKFDLDSQLQQDGSRFKVPQMGWNRVKQRIDHPLWRDIPNDAYFYFVHSYFAVPDNVTDIAAETEYGRPFCCAIARDNIFATQFHPEKSAKVGLQLYRNFVNWFPH